MPTHYLDIAFLFGFVRFGSIGMVWWRFHSHSFLVRVLLILSTYLSSYLLPY